MAGDMICHPHELEEIMQGSIDNDTSLGFDHPGSLSPAKPDTISIDLLDLLSAKTPYTPSSFSAYDCVSVRTDDDNVKPSMGMEQFLLKPIKGLGSSKLELGLVPGLLDQKMTLGEIISKRSYTKRPKETQKTIIMNEDAIKKKKRAGCLEKDMEEVIMKKEKHNDGGCRGLLVPMDERPMVPELVLKDGKVQLSMPSAISEEREIRKELEIVKPGKKKVTTSTSFKKVNHTEKWTEKETEKFYRALELFGTDFSMIAKVFKNRNRNQIKNKFLREEKLFPEKVNAAFKEAQTSNFQTLFIKFQKIKRMQTNNQVKSIFERDEMVIHKGLNLLRPFQKPQSKIEIKQEELDSCFTSKDGQSENCNCTVDIDSIDEDIMEDLADILLPQKNLSTNQFSNA
jgi:hypothetical protein